MTRPQKKYFLFLLILGLLYFAVFYFPNAAASQNVAMVAVFEPDESVPLPYVMSMIQPAATLKQALINFAFYRYYFYGFPHFAVSALALLPLRLFNYLDNISLVMAVLRQLVSVLPMLAAILVLVFLQTEFKTYKSIVLFVFLLSIPAVVQNNFWWHPDSLAILFAFLTILFLSRDHLRLGKNFYLAAVMCGISAGTKETGLYFFLTVLVYLLVCLFVQKKSFGNVLISGLGFSLIMALAYLFANPILVYSSVRDRYFTVMRSQSELLTLGYQVIYEKGLVAAWPSVKEYYGDWIFLSAVLSVNLYGINRGLKSSLYWIIATWSIPITVMVFGIIHFKYQYWLPVALPLFSSLVLALPDSQKIKEWLGRVGNFRYQKSLDNKSENTTYFDFQAIRSRIIPFCSGIIFCLVIIQFVVYLKSDVIRYQQRLTRAEANPSIQFYGRALNALAPLPRASYQVYQDVRMYVPRTPGWHTSASFDLLTYNYIQSQKFDIVLLMQQRIYDYTNPNAVGVDPATFAQSQIFYGDANAGHLQGYRLVYRNLFGLVFVSEPLYEKYFTSQVP